MAHQKKLWDAAQDGDAEKMELAIGCGANVNMPDEERFGATALHMAASNGHSACIKILAASEANITDLDEDGFQAIHQAAKEGHCDALSVLIEAKADPEVPAMRGVRALHMASRYGHLNVVELLIEKKTQLRSLGDDGEQPIHHAAEKGHDSVVKCLVKANANVSVANAKGQTPLHLAAENRHAGVVATLLEEGADGNAVDENKKTAQELAQANGHKNVVSVLKAFSPAPSQILHILAGIRNMVDAKLDKCEARLGTLEAKAGIEPCDGAPFAPGGGAASAELSAELANTKAELAEAMIKIASLVPECPLDDKRQAASLALFTKLDDDGSGYLDVDEFTVIMRKLDPRIDQNGVINTFKKAGVQQALNIDQFYQWIHVMFGKADDATFEGLMTMFNDGT
jgi:ankyrin repeat protein